MEDLLIENICGNSGVLKAFRILGYVILVLKILIPIFLILTSMKSLFKALMEDSPDTKAQTKMFISKFVIGAFVFFIPNIVYTIVSFVGKSKDTIDTFATCAVCLTNVTSCDSKVDQAVERETQIALSKEAKYLTEREKKLLAVREQKDEEKKKSAEAIKNAIETSGSGGIGSTNGYGRGCTGFVSSSSYDSAKANGILAKGRSYLGTPYVYGSTDCSWFVGKAAAGYISPSSAAGEAGQTKNKCVQPTDVKPGDIFFASQYNSSYQCINCANTGRCDRFNCIMHTGIVYEVKNGVVTKILHNGGTGVQIVNRTYNLTPGNGSQWVIMFTRPYA